MQFVSSMSDVQTQIQKVLLSMNPCLPTIVKFVSVNKRGRGGARYIIASHLEDKTNLVRFRGACTRGNTNRSPIHERTILEFSDFFSMGGGGGGWMGVYSVSRGDCE